MIIDDNHHYHTTNNPICELRVADSIFLGYICTHPTLDAIEQYRQELIDNHHSSAAHVPYAASLTVQEGGAATAAAGVQAGIISDDGGNSSSSEGYDDDDEPTGSKVGLTLLKELNRYKKCLRRQSTMKIRGGSGSANAHRNSMMFDEEEEEENAQTDLGECGGPPPIATAIIIVRYFQERLLGVTCGRLRSLYERTAKLALHRHLNYGKDNVPFVERYNTFSGDSDQEEKGANLYGLGAGDTELIVNVVPQSTSSSDSDNNTIVDDLLNELQFEGMVGSKNEPLPRLQNLLADLPVVDGTNGNNTIIPIYRYPGNYSGTEWPTHTWSPTALSIKTAVEEALKPLYNQSMNHCVTNLYRTGTDRIDRHSDKDLDLNRSGVIVSVSIGSKRIMEVRDRVFPHDTCYVELPSGSMFVLGPYTNARFTHAILPMEEIEEHSNRRVGFAKKGENASSEKLDVDATCNVLVGGRISLTLRDVRTFLDVKTDRLFGQGISSSVDSPIVLDDNGVITKESLTKAALPTRAVDRRERNGAMAIALGIGAIAGYSTAGSKSGASKGSEKSTLLRSIATMVVSTSASYWYLQRSRSKARQQREKREARVFFSKKSASGNKY